MNDRLISVVMPTYNREQMLEDSINSVLNQTYRDFELIIVDDGSIDNTDKLVKNIKDKRIKYIKNSTNVGAAEARNIGVKSAKGDYIAFHDSDDLWKMNHLEVETEYLEKNDVDMVCAYYIYQDKKGDLYQIPQKGNEKIINQNYFCYWLEFPSCSPETMLIKKDKFMEVGGFNSDLKNFEDYEFSLRFAQKYKVCFCPCVLSVVNYTEGSVNFNRREREKTYLYILDEFWNEINKYNLAEKKYIEILRCAKSLGNVHNILKRVDDLLSKKQILNTNIVYQLNESAKLDDDFLIKYDNKRCNKQILDALMDTRVVVENYDWWELKQIYHNIKQFSKVLLYTKEIHVEIDKFPNIDNVEMARKTLNKVLDKIIDFNS